MQFESSLLWLGLSASLISANPLRLPVTATDVKKLFTRGDDNVRNLKNFIPDCHNIDPGQNSEDSKYKKDEERHNTRGQLWHTDCSNEKKSNKKDLCVTEYFLVDYQFIYDNWAYQSNELHCDSTSSCNLQLGTSNQHCEANTVTWDNKFQGTIEKKLNDTMWLVGGMSLKFEYAHNMGGNKLTLHSCIAENDSVRCTWEDKACHALWAAQQTLHINGYMRRTCAGSRKNTNMSFKRKDEKYTIGMLDFSITFPAPTMIGCAAKCGATKYPERDPYDSKVHAFTKDDMPNY